MLSLLLVEVFTEYGISMCFLLLRFFARWWTAGIRSFDLGDAFAGAAMVFYSLETAGIYLLLKFGNNIGLDAETAMAVPDSQVPSLVLGSKLAFINWVWYMTFIWCLKGILLTLFWKMGKDIVRQEILVKAISAFVLCSYVACVLTHILICTPPWKGWQIKPYPGDNCTVRGPNYWVISTLNVLSDLAVMAIPAPLLWKVRIPLRRKLMLGSIFALGFFVMIATILRAYYSLLSLETLPTALGWASRETFFATLAAVAPGIKPLFSKSRWTKATSQEQSQGYYERSNMYTGGFSDPGQPGSTAVHVTANAEHDGSHRQHAYEMAYWKRPQGRNRKNSSSASDEKSIIDDRQSEKKDFDVDRDIFITQEIAVNRYEPADRV